MASSATGSPTATPEDKWREAIALSAQILADRPRFEAMELDYKHKIVERVQATFAAARAGQPIVTELKRSFGGGNNLLHYIDVSRFRNWVEENEQTACEALLELEAGAPLSERIDAFLALIPADVIATPGSKIAFAAFFLMGLDPREHPLYRAEPIKNAEKLLGWPSAPPATSLGTEYAEHHLPFVATFRERLQQEGLDVRDMLDAQSLLWTLMKYGDDEYRAFRGDLPAAEAGTRARVQAALVDYDPAVDAEQLEQGERERAEILRRFPRQAWKDLALTDYAIGQDDSSHTYCRWVEFQSQHLGSIRGGQSAKLIIYRRKNSGEWHYDTQRFSSVDDAWDAVRQAFDRALELGEHDEWAAIDDLDELRPGQALLVKTLHIYLREQLLPIFSRAHLRHFLQLIERPDTEDATAVALSRRLLSEMRALGRPELTTNELMYFLYRHFPPPETASWWKISPGEQASMWEQCRDNGYVCVGWPQMGDLREYANKDDYKRAFEETYRTEYNDQPHIISRKASEFWRLMELRPGDRIVANRGKSKILAVGTVREPVYDFDASLDDMPNLVYVDWDESYAKDIPQQGGWLGTIDKVTAEQRKLIEGPATPPPSAEVPALYRKIAEALTTKRQVILYGPPGTGKTFHTLRFAAWWLATKNGDPTNESLEDAEARAAALERYGRPTGSSTNPPSGHPLPGQLTLTTFHPSYAYEDFVEGFRPVPSEGGELVLRVEDGVFKRVCRAAQNDPENEYLLVIDEINRANIAKVFGELITLIEADKRGLEVTLPQSKERFHVPANVTLLGTMNTADRSITLLDVALRRRFAFFELLPDPELVEQAVGSLDLAAFLAGLNRRVAQVAGREKQVGHAYLMPGGKVVSEPADFARIFRLEIVPLLQEYCYEEYGLLEEILGEELVDVQAQTLNEERLDDPEALVETLAEQFASPAAADL